MSKEINVPCQTFVKVMQCECGDVKIKDDIRCKESVDYEREVLEDSFRI